MTLQIDFLPASYHEERRIRRTKLWRRGALGAFLVLIALGAAHHYTSHHALKERRNRLQSQASSMLAQLQSPDELKQRVARLDARAELIAFLRLRIAPTRILAAVTGSRPRFVALTELKAGHEKRASGGNRQATGKKPAEPADDSQKTPEQLDLQRLKDKTKQTALFVTLRGLAPDDISIAQYLSNLEKSEVFQDAQLLYTDRYEIRDSSLRRFSIRLRVAEVGRKGSPGRETVGSEQALSRTGRRRPAPSLAQTREETLPP